MRNWKEAVLTESATVRDAISNLNEVAIQIVMITDSNGVLVGTLSDGDIRRGLLKGIKLSSIISPIINRNPLVVPEGCSRNLAKELMDLNKVAQIPVIDDARRLAGIHLWNESSDFNERSNIMVIMAGGKGTRLRPYTEDCPKPMLKVNNKPMLEHIIESAKVEGFKKFIITTHYLGNIIEDYFGDGSNLNIEIKYIREQSPLGTAGALSLIENMPEEPFLITNGDVISDIKYGELLDFHKKHHAIGTMAVKVHELQNPFGIVDMEGINIKGFVEKPIYKSYINAGIYVLNRGVLSLLQSDKHCDMPELFLKLKENDKLIIGYPMHEPWRDIGRPDDLKAIRLMTKND